MKDILVIYHGHCTDGFGAAYSAWKKLQDTADYIGLTHGDPLPNVANKTVYILDFSFKKDVYLDLLTQAKEVILLDHHKTAKDVLDGVQGCFFDLERSGAMLSWNYFHPDIPAPRFIHYIQDFDLFQFKFPETVYFYRGINALADDFSLWSQFEDESYLNSVLEQGKIIDTFFQSQIKDIARNAKPVKLFGQEGLMVNATGMFATELGHILASQCNSYALIWSESQHSIKCSLRSVPNYDCSTIATRMNGGGHPQACAFTVENLEIFTKFLKDQQNA